MYASGTILKNPIQIEQRPIQPKPKEQKEVFVPTRKPEPATVQIPKPPAPTSNIGLSYQIGTSQAREPKVYSPPVRNPPSDTPDPGFKSIQLSQNENIVLYLRRYDSKTKTQELIFEDIFLHENVSGTIKINYVNPLPENRRQRFEILGRNPLVCVHLDVKNKKSKLVIMDIKKVQDPNFYEVVYDLNRSIELSYISESDSEPLLNLTAKTTDGEYYFVQMSKDHLNVYDKNLKLVKKLEFEQEIATIDTLTQKDYYLLAIGTQDNNKQGDLFIYELAKDSVFKSRKPIYVNYGGNYNYRTVKILDNSQVVLIGINQELDHPAIKCKSFGLSGMDKGTAKLLQV